MESFSEREAMEDARGVVANYTPAVSDNNCLPALRQSVNRLEKALDVALDSRADAPIPQAHSDAVDRAVAELLSLRERCGPVAQSLMQDVSAAMKRKTRTDESVFSER